MATEEAAAADSSGWRRYRPLVGAVPALLLAAIAVWEIVATARAGSDVPDGGDWQRAAEVVRSEFVEGDLIVFAPRWLDPVGRQHLGDRMTVAMAARADSARYRRIWELSARGARAPETRGLAPAWSRRFGELELRRYHQTPVEVVTDFVDAFSTAGGLVRGAARVELAEVGFEPHRCVLARPTPGGIVSVRYPGVALGSTLVGYVGLADVFTRRDDREPGRLEAYVNGERVAGVEVGVDDGWVRFEVATEPRAAADVELRATAVGPKARRRLVCFAVEARR